ETSGSKTWMMLLSAIAFGVVAAVLSVLYLKSREAAIREMLLGEDDVMVEVIVPGTDLLKGTRLSEDQLLIFEMPEKYVPDSTIRPSNYQDFLGSFMLKDVTEGRPLLATDIDAKFPKDFSDLIEPGHRAMTIQVDELNSMSGMIRAGNQVDIYVIIQTKISGYNPEAETAAELPESLANAALSNLNLPEGTPIPDEVKNLVGLKEKPKDVILPVLQDVGVLATGREAYEAYLDQYNLPQQRLDDSFTAMTLDVSPRQVGLLSLAADKGDLVAVLRNRDDRSLADFEGITPFDLIKEAARLKELGKLRKAAEAAGATIDEDGNWVSADGTIINGDDIVINDNGNVTTKNGILLGAKGLSVNENGEYVDANGNVIDPNDIIVNADGSITTKQALMEAAGYTLNENGDYVDKDGNVVKPDDIVVNADGSVTTKQALMEAAGYTLNENGEYVDKDGNVINPDDVIVLANGTVMTKDGKIISGDNVTINKDGFIIAEDGTVMTADGKVLEGVFVDENGNVIGPDGEIMRDSNLTVAADGTVRDSNGNIVDGISGSSIIQDFDDSSFEDALENLANKRVNLIIGGASKDGKAKTVPLTAEPVEALLQQGASDIDEDDVYDE
ncbi:MAG: Flp pilus assembly protein CpaB, partial [Pseudomonadota bacterium]